MDYVEVVGTLGDYALDVLTADKMRHSEDDFVNKLSWASIATLLASMVVNMVLVKQILQKNRQFFLVIQRTNNLAFVVAMTLAVTNAQVLVALVVFARTCGRGARHRVLVDRADIVIGEVKSKAMISHLCENIPQFVFQGTVVVYQWTTGETVTWVQLCSLASTFVMLFAKMATNAVFMTVSGALTRDGEHETTLSMQTISDFVTKRPMMNLWSACTAANIFVIVMSIVTIAGNIQFMLNITFTNWRVVGVAIYFAEYIILAVCFFSFIYENNAHFVHLLLAPNRVLAVLLCCYIHPVLAVLLNPLSTKSELAAQLAEGRILGFMLPHMLARLLWVGVYACAAWKSSFPVDEKILLALAAANGACVLVSFFSFVVGDMLGGDEAYALLDEEEGRKMDALNTEDGGCMQTILNLQKTIETLRTATSDNQMKGLLRTATEEIDKLKGEVLKEDSQSQQVVSADLLFSIEGVSRQASSIRLLEVFSKPNPDDATAVLERSAKHVSYATYEKIEELYKEFERLVEEDITSGDEFNTMLERARGIKDVPELAAAIAEGAKVRGPYKKLNEALASYEALQGIERGYPEDVKRCSDAAKKAIASIEDTEVRARQANNFKTALTRADMFLNSNIPAAPAAGAEAEPKTDDGLEERPEVDVEGNAKYKGQWKGKVYHGYGRMQRADGSMYLGQFQNGRAEGEGKFVSANGNIYEGSWKGDRAHGFGKYTHEDGSMFEGQWENDQKNGMGSETSADGSKYVGSYKTGKKDGSGKFYSSDGGLVYDGSFKEDKMSGQGSYNFADGRKYIGAWESGHMSGAGKMTWKDGNVYEGQFKSDKRDGVGKLMWNDGRVYDGQWSDGKQHGEGTLIAANGKKSTGQWRNGSRVNAEE